MYDETAHQTELRERAVRRLKKRRDFYGHVLIYTLVNAFLVVIWFVTANSDSFFWPIFPMVGWGIAVVMNAWDVYFNKKIDDESIDREIRHMQHH